MKPFLRPPTSCDEVFPPGSVVLLGAGPGAADLLTLRALDRIARADVVVHDRLISDEVMQLLPIGAIRINAGKAAGRHLLRQEAIHACLIEQARQGHRVLRLKGGDPYVFGRGGEEAQALDAAGIPWELVPGLTAATACTAAAGIPLTHRDWASQCSFHTAHAAADGRQLDAMALARPHQTRVFYMGQRQLPVLAEQLRAAGLDDDTPAAWIVNGTRPQQQVSAGPWREVRQHPPSDPDQPALLVIGETVALSPHYRPGPDRACTAAVPACASPVDGTMADA